MCGLGYSGLVVEGPQIRPKVLLDAADAARWIKQICSFLAHPFVILMSIANKSLTIITGHGVLPKGSSRFPGAELENYSIQLSPEAIW